MDNSIEIKNEVQKLMQINAICYKKVIVRGQNSNIFNNEVDADDLVHFAMGTFRLQMLKWKLSNFSFDIETQGMKTMTNLLILLKK